MTKTKSRPPSRSSLVAAAELTAVCGGGFSTSPGRTDAESTTKSIESRDRMDPF